MTVQVLSIWNNWLHDVEEPPGACALRAATGDCLDNLYDMGWAGNCDPCQSVFAGT